MIACPATGTEQDIDKVNAICMDDGERASVRVRACTPGVVTELNAQTGLL